MNITTSFRVIANDDDITRQIRNRFRSMRLVDETGSESDSLEICLADHDGVDRIKLPPTGAELKVFLGYGQQARMMGLFVVDAIELSGVPSEMTIKASAAPYETSAGGKTDLQSQKTRSWEAGITIGDMVKRIAGEHRLKHNISAKLASIALPHTDQVSESDMNLLRRLARRYDAIAKVAGGSLIFAPLGDAVNAIGGPMPRITITPKDGSAYRVTIASRDSAGTCIAYWRDVKAAKRYMVKVGEGDPVRRLRHAYRDSASAESAARAELRKRARGERGLTYTMPGNPEMKAESIAVMQGFRSGVDGDWIVTRAEHYIGPNGYATTIDGVRPNSDAAVAPVDAAEADDEEQGAVTIAAEAG